MILNFGKYKGLSLQEILDKDPSYIVWLDNHNIIDVSNDILVTALCDTMSPDIEDLHPDWGNRE